MRPERCFTGPSPTQRSSRGSPRVLAHGLFREYQRRRGLGPRTGQHQDLPPQGISLKSVTTLRQLAAERGEEPERARRMWCGPTKRLSSVDHFLRKGGASSRQRGSEEGQGQWQVRDCLYRVGERPRHASPRPGQNSPRGRVGRGALQVQAAGVLQRRLSSWPRSTG